MSRSLFALLHQRFGNPVSPATRRQFLQASLAVGAGLIPSCWASGAGARRADGKRVVVVGAGFSGLACAHELLEAGYQVTVVEARQRISGRVLSFNAALGGEFIEGRNVEGGGELIGSNHPHWVAYADKFGLEFLDVSDPQGDRPLLLDGRRLSADESRKLFEEMDAVLSRMNEDAKPIDADAPWDSPDAEALDRRSLQDWIDSQQDVSPMCRRAIAFQQGANNGNSPARQSYLGNLAMVKGGGLEKFWTESEVYRCDGGNQQLAIKLAASIGDERLLRRLPVRSIEQREGEVVVTCADDRRLVCDDVVFTAPPSTWSKVTLDPPLPADLKPQMGVNVKFLAHVKSRFWNAEGLDQYALTDGPVSMTWDGTDGQPGDDNASLNCFSGGPSAEQCLAFPPGKRNERYAELLEALYPGFKDQFVKSRFMSWPRDPWTLAGYSFPAPGQVTRIGPQLAAGLGHLHFAGEHTCYKFVGYMEGALSSGVAVARRLAQRDGVLEAVPAR